jgi:hypothetical protein
MSLAGQPHVVPISGEDAPVDLVGGKGRSLCRLVSHGLPATSPSDRRQRPKICPTIRLAGAHDTYLNI